MIRRSTGFRILTGTLALGFLLLLGATTGSAFAHEVQHAGHHSAGMHGTGICAWMCAAGQGIESAPLTIAGGVAPVATLPFVLDVACPSSPHATSPTRGPPSPRI